MQRLLSVFSVFLLLQAAFAQSPFRTGTWHFSFLIAGKPATISDRYHATYFEIQSDGSFLMGLSEASESGQLFPDSTMRIQHYDYNRYMDTLPARYRVVHCSAEHLVISYSENPHAIPAIPEVYYVYCKKALYSPRKQRRLYRQLTRAGMIN